MARSVVKSIQIFRYMYAPSVATVRDKVGNKKILKRKVSRVHEINLNDLTTLTTVIRNIESYEGGVKGKAEFQYIELVTRSDGKNYEDFKILYEFYINKALKIMIIAGDGLYRNQIKNILAKFFNENTSHVMPIVILRDRLYNLVNKIKTDGPKKKGEYKNIMKQCNYYNSDLDSHKGVKKEDVEMFDNDNNPICVSVTDSFKRNFPDCDTFDTKMRIFKCNAIWVPTIMEEAILEMKCSAEFSLGMNPTFEAWIIFVVQTCKPHLPL